MTGEAVPSAAGTQTSTTAGTDAGAAPLPPLVAPGPELTPDEIARFARHLPLPQIGMTGQRRLRNARVLVVGAGGLGSPVLQYLAAAGVGALTVVDDDVVDDSNLQRQIIHSVDAIGTLKVESAKQRLAAIAPGTKVTALPHRIDADNALELFSAHDLVVDGADNFATRYVCNDAAELTGTPLVWGTLFQFTGQISTFVPGRGPMLRDLFPDIPDADSVPSCALGGVFGALCGQVGSLMATEAIKLICGVGRPLIGRLAMVDALGARMTELRFPADPGRAPVTRIERPDDVCAPSAGAGDSAGALTCAVAPDADLEVGEEFLADAEGEAAAGSAAVLVDVREDWEREVLARPGAIALPLGRIEESGWEAVAPLLDDGTTDVVFMCKTGVRSLTAARLLAERPGDDRREAGTASPSAATEDAARPSVYSLAGGILGWARRTGNPIVY